MIYFAGSTTFHMMETEPLPIFERLELICIVWFIFEYVLKMLVSYDRMKTFLRLMNIIDLLAILPFIIEAALSLFGFNTKNMRDLKVSFHYKGITFLAHQMLPIDSYDISVSFSGHLSILRGVR